MGVHERRGPCDLKTDLWFRFSYTTAGFSFIVVFNETETTSGAVFPLFSFLLEIPINVISVQCESTMMTAIALHKTHKHKPYFICE